MSRPVLYGKTPFDADYPTVFRYAYDGERQFGSQMTIRDAMTNDIVYQDKQTTFVLAYHLPGGILTNGNSYTAEITVFNADDAEVGTSSKQFFRTFATPVFGVSNLKDNQIIDNSSYELQVIYEQADGEPLNEYQIKLYGYGGSLIHSSRSLYPVSSGMSYTLTSLLDNYGYELELTGITVNGMAVSAAKIHFTVEYINPSTYSEVFLENVPELASVKVQSNFVMVEGRANHTPVAYMDGEKVYLKEEGKWVEFDEGFKIAGDFALEIIGEDFPLNKTFFEMNDKSGVNNIEIFKNYGTMSETGEVQEYFVLHVTGASGLVYRIISEYFEPLQPDQQVSIVLRRKGGLFSLNAELIMSDKPILPSINLGIGVYNTGRITSVSLPQIN